MSDAPNVASAAGGEPTPAPEIDKKLPTAPVADEPLLTPGDDDAGSDDAQDWRDRIAKAAGVGEDAKYRAWLNRFSSEENYHKAVPKLRRDFSANRAQPALPEDATPEEIAAHRKALGIPDKPEGYGLTFPAEMNPTEVDVAGLNGWAAYAHMQGLPPAAAKAGAAYYAKIAADSRAAQAEFAREAEADARAELRKEWGRREFDRNLTLAYEFLEQHMGDKAPALSGIRLADGRFLGKHPDFVRLLVAAGRATADEEALIGGDGAGGGKSIEDEIKELVAKSVASPKGLSKTDDARLNQLFEARTAREEKQGRARATSAAA